MRSSALSCMIFTGLACCQAQTTSGAATQGLCSPANTGDRNIFNITCGIGKEQGDKMLAILNRIIGNQINPSAVMKKLDELQKDVERIKSQPQSTNNCPNGICVSGGVVDHPTVNNFQPPPPRITWTSSTVEGSNNNGPFQGPDAGHPGVRVLVTVAGRFQFPMFAVRCDRPCSATEIGVEGASSPRLYTTNRPDVAVAGFAGFPAQIGGRN